MRLAAPLLIVAILLLAGCGDSSETTAPAPAGAKAPTQKVRAAWERNPECKRPKDASRWGCSVGSYRCQGVVTGRGWSISCSKPGGSIAFTVPRD